MSTPRARSIVGPLVAVALIGACDVPREAEPATVLHSRTDGHDDGNSGGDRKRANLPTLGLMTSLPLYWPQGTDMMALARGTVAMPWQREQLERQHNLVMLDTLSPIAGSRADTPDMDPLEGLERLAVIQPRGLSPSDNVALDNWVRGGGKLLLVLDPALTGHYDAALGDPRRPVDTALIPPVVERWGLTMIFDETQASVREVTFDAEALRVALAGEFRRERGGGSNCRILAQGIVASCAVDRGEVTLVADAATFEHQAGPVHNHHEGGAGQARMNDSSTAKDTIDIARLLEHAFVD